MNTRMRQRGRTALLYGGLLALLTAGCEGRNLFGPGAGLGPQMIVFSVPATVNSGENLSVQTRAVSSIRVDSTVVTAKSADFEERQVRTSENNQTDFSSSLTLTIPEVITDTLVVVTGVAYDAQGNGSIPIVDTVRVIDMTPPTATALTAVADTVVGQARNLQLSIQAEDNIGLTWIGYQIRRPDSTVVFSDSVPTTGKTRTRAFTYPVPANLPLGMYSVNGFARDIDGNRSAGGISAAFRVIFIDDVRPGVVILEPAANLAVAEGANVLVRTRVTDNDRISRIRIEGVALRGDPNLGTNQVVERYAMWDIPLSPAKADTTITRNLVPNGVLGAETAYVIVTAWDQQDNFSADTTAIQIIADSNPPLVTIGTPGAGAQIQVNDSTNTPIPLIATVADPNGFVTSGVVSVQFRGFRLEGDPLLLNQVEIEMFTPQEVVLNPPRVLAQAIQRNMTLLQVPDTTTTAYFVVTARDARGNIGADTVQFTLTRDDVAPTIQIIDPPAGTGIPFNDSLLVTARLQDTDGVVSVTFDGVAHRGSRDLGTHQEVVRFTPKTVNFGLAVEDTTVSRYLQQVASTVSEPVYIRVVTRDSEGNTARDSVLITLGGPRVQLPDLITGTTVPAGSVLPIRVTAQDPTGINLIEIEITGVDNPPVFQDAVLAGQDPTNIDLTYNYTVPPAISGPLNIRARARNAASIFGASPTVALTVIGAGGADVTPPEVRILVQPQGSSGDPNRVEATDPIRISVTARDNTGGSGIAQTGYTVRAVRRGNLLDTLWVTDAQAPGVVGGTVTRIFNPTFLSDFRDSNGDPFFDPVNRPDTIDLDFFGWAQDAAGVPNCAAAVSSTTFQQLTCETRAIPAFASPGSRSSILDPAGGPHIVATGQNGQRVAVAIVSGQTVRLPNGGSVADAVVDVPNERVYMANIGLSRLEVFDMNTNTFGSSVLVGAQPWGLAFDRFDPNRLLVANSGGTNLSFVDLTALSEVESDRIFTPNEFLINIYEEISQAGGLTYTSDPVIDFSDRPQFVAMDINGEIVYSTRPTIAATDGTIRIADRGNGGLERPQITIFTDYAQGNAEDGAYAVSNICCGSFGPSITLGAYQPFTNRTVPRTQLNSSTYTTVGGTSDAVVELAGRPEFAVVTPIFRPRVRGGETWEVENVGLNDTTFIAASGTGNRIVIGEGDAAETARIILWDAATQTSSAAVEVVDLVNNAAERVLGVAMNYDGRMGVARGSDFAYFFDAELRLQGEVDVGEGGGGVALHPLHTVEDNGEQAVAGRLAFVPVGNNTIEIWDTFNFTRLGTTHVRDQIVGPLRAVLPFAGDNAGLACPATFTVAGDTGVDYTGGANDDACIVVKLVGSTLGGGVGVVNVTIADVTAGP